MRSHRNSRWARPRREQKSARAANLEDPAKRDEPLGDATSVAADNRPCAGNQKSARRPTAADYKGPLETAASDLRPGDFAPAPALRPAGTSHRGGCTRSPSAGCRTEPITADRAAHRCQSEKQAGGTAVWSRSGDDSRVV